MRVESQLPSRLRTGVALILSVSACSPERLYLFAEPLEGSDFSALVIASPEGIRATGLIPAGEALELPFPPRDLDAVSVWVFGFSRAELEATGPLPDASELRDTPLVSASGCTARLTPDQANLVRGVPSSAEPVVTADWWRTRCPSRVRDNLRGVVDIRCVQTSCGRSARQTGCQLEIDLTDCGTEAIRGVVQPDGSLCLETPSCETTPTEPPAWAGLDCAIENSATPTCQFDLVEATGEDAFEVETLWSLGEEPQPGDYEAIDQFSGELGYLGGLLVKDDFIALVHYGGFFYQRAALPDSSRVALFDLGTGELRTTTPTVAARLVALTPDPEGGGFLAAQDARTVDYSVLRFSADGEILQVARIPVSLDARGLSTTPLKLVHVPDEDRLLAFSYIDGNSNATVRTGLIHELDPITLEVLDEHIILETRAQLRDAQALGNGRIAVVSDTGNQVILLDTQRFDVARSQELPNSSVDMGELTLWPELGRLSVVSIGGGGGIFMFDSTRLEFIARAVEYERVFEPTGSFRLSEGSGGVVTAGTLDGEPVAYVSPFNPESVRFLPGSTRLGYGVAGATQVLDEESVLITLPHAGELLRVRRR